MNFNIFQDNKYFENPTLVLLAVCFVLFLAGAILFESNSCAVSNYMYSSHRLVGTYHPSFFCKIF